jgi:hypothetical protein
MLPDPPKNISKRLLFLLGFQFRHIPARETPTVKLFGSQAPPPVVVRKIWIAHDMVSCC